MKQSFEQKRLSELFPECADVVALLTANDETQSLFLRHRYMPVLRDEFSKQMNGKGHMPLADSIVESIGRFVLDKHPGVPKRGFQAEPLRAEVVAHARDLISRVETMKLDSDDMDYHDGISYRNRLAGSFARFHERCQNVLMFLDDRFYSTRKTDPDLRSAYIAFKIEMKDALPKIISDMHAIDSVYNVHHRAQHPERALFF